MPKIQVLDVFLYNKFVGRLTSNNAILTFLYDKKYLHNKNALKLSSSLPLEDKEFDHQTTSAFFSGLLPDDIMRYKIARYLGISQKNTFELLKEIGGECAGAVAVYPEGMTPDNITNMDYLILEEDEADNILTGLDKRPLLAGEENIRISGAGAQDKLMVALIDKKLAIPKNNTPSTHIIKPSIRHLQDSVYNEFFCMNLAKIIGLSVPKTDILWIKDNPYYLVERYDRRITKDGDIIRLHQEDFCQSMAIPPEIKYENEGGPSLKQCFNLINDHIKIGLMPGKSKLILLDIVIFNFLIGNGDAHGKNFSILYDGKGEYLAPFYDLLSTIIYFNSYKARMAMKIGGKYKFNEITISEFIKLSDKINVKNNFIRNRVKIIANKVLEGSINLENKLKQIPHNYSPIYKDIIDVIKKHQMLLTSY